mgnify:CR=1 FL=1
MRSALLCASIAERLFIISQFWKICGFSRIAFSQVGFGTNSLSQNLTVLPAPSGREPLARPETLRFSQKLCRHAKASPFEERLPPRRGKMSRSDKRGSVDLRSKDGEGEDATPV